MFSLTLRATPAGQCGRTGRGEGLRWGTASRWDYRQGEAPRQALGPRTEEAPAARQRTRPYCISRATAGPAPSAPAEGRRDAAGGSGRRHPRPLTARPRSGRTAAGPGVGGRRGIVSGSERRCPPLHVSQSALAERPPARASLPAAHGPSRRARRRRTGPTRPPPADTPDGEGLHRGKLKGGRGEPPPAASRPLPGPCAAASRRPAPTASP